MKRRQAGFSFIEILVVMGIISVLVSMVVVVVPMIQEKAKRTLSAADDKRLIRELTKTAPRNDGTPDRTPEAAARERTARRELRDLYVVGVGTLLRLPVALV